MSLRAAWCLLILVVCCSPSLAGEVAADPSWLQVMRRELPPFQIQRVELGRLFCPAVSPHGTWVADLRDRVIPTEANVYPQSLLLFDSWGKLVRDLTGQQLWYVQSFAWSQTEDALLLQATVQEPVGLWKLDLRTYTFSRPRLPWLPGKAPIYDHVLPIWSPDGGSYLVQQSRHISDTRIDQSIYSISWPSGVHRKLAQGGEPVWSPNGNWIMFGEFLSGSGTTDLWAMKRDGTHQHRLLRSMGPSRCWVTSRSCILVPTLAAYGKNLEVLSPPGFWLFDLERRTAKWNKLDDISDLYLVSSSRDGCHLYLRIGTRKSPPHYETYLLDFWPQVAFEKEYGSSARLAWGATQPT